VRLASRLVVFDYLSSLLGGEAADIRKAAKRVEFGGGRYLDMFASWGAQVLIDADELAEYDSNVRGIEDRLGKRRPGFRFTYFQYLAAMYAEVYLHRLAADPEKLLAELKNFGEGHAGGVGSLIRKEDLQRAAFWMATGSGKTLIAHANLMQFRHYESFVPDSVLVVPPSPTLAQQHLNELALSGINARHALAPGDARAVQVLEITKLYVDGRDDDRPRGGDSLPTSAFEGRNLVLVDEGHKGSKSEERTWRQRRDALAGDGGFTFEYSATFAQITENDDALLDEYGKAIIFDYGYRHFWEDGYGKDYRVINVRKEGSYDTDELLLAGLLIFYEQISYFQMNQAAIRPYNIEKPLAVFVGAFVSGQVDSEVLEIVRFLDRVLSDERWAVRIIGNLLDRTSNLPGDLFTHEFPHLSELELSPAYIYADMRRSLFRGEGRLQMHMIVRGRGEIGLRTKDADRDVYCGVINVGDPGKLAKLARESGVAQGEDDHISDSLFRGIEERESQVCFLIGSKKFIEGWSSWRVSAMGLLKVGKSAGPQVIQLFGRGVRLKGKGFGLRRSEALHGHDHPKHLKILETIHILGLRADYLEAFNEAIRREDSRLRVQRVLPVTARDDLDNLGLVAPEPVDRESFAKKVVMFDPSKLTKPINVNLLPSFTTVDGASERKSSHGAGPRRSLELPMAMIDNEELYLELLAYKRRKGWYNIYITRESVKAFLQRYAVVTAVEGSLDDTDERTCRLVDSAGRAALHRGLDRFVYLAEREHEKEGLTVGAITSAHGNFPTARKEGAATLAYQLEVPEDLIDEVDGLLASLSAGEAVLEDLVTPVPRLHIDAHLYNPVLVKEAKVGDAGEQQALFREVAVRSIPSGLVASEVEFLRDLGNFWEEAQEGDSAWVDYEIYVLRNLPRRGVGFFATAGFYPDFML